uniref:DNA-directed RNA polymerase n=1 Tax=Colemanosphaera charkowiensis TaxID=51706 RepID=A0A6C0RX86_9CHLO|nr:RNA polymerase subunit alpha [Colemanosphaera charkowiensis]
MTKTGTTDFFIACKESRIETNTSFYGCFYLGPFDDSLSQTLANDLRRTLLSELTGLAITSVEIEGVLHKFSNLPGMKESVLDLICNLQSIVLKKQEIGNTNITYRTTKKTYAGFLNVRGPRVIKARDLKLPSGLQCVDPNQYIATLAEDGFLNMKFNINEGKNFIKQKPHNLDVNVLKKRNILLQNFRSQRLRVKENESFKLQFSKPLNELLESKNNLAESNHGSNPIPLDAVFMPVTKINCLIEENNLYSDFSTDSIYYADETSENRPLYPKRSSLLSTAIYKNKAKMEQPSKKSGLSKALSSSPYIDFQFFLNQMDYNSIYQTLYYLNLNEKYKIKLIPWQSNSLYFDISNHTNQASPLSKNGALFCLSQEHSSFSKIKSFLTCKASKKARFLYSEENKSVVATKQPVNAFQTQTNLTSNKKSTPEPHLIKQFLSTINQKTSFKINSVKGMNQQNMYLEYAKNIKLKPLRKNSHLIMEIWTNGSIHPRQALYESFIFLSNTFLKLQTIKMFGTSKGNNYLNNFKLKKLKNQSIVNVLEKPILFQAELTYGNNSYISTIDRVLLSFDMPVFKTTNKLGYSSNLNHMNFYLKSSLKAPIGILKISLRAYTALKKAGIFTLKDLIKYSKTDLLKIKNLGRKSLVEIETSLSDLGLVLLSE